MTVIDATELFSPETLEEPYPLYARMRDLGPVCRIGDTRAFFLGTHAAVDAAVKRHEDFSANLNGMLVCSEDQRPYVFSLDSAGTSSNVIATADEPEHSVHRRLMLPPLKASRIEQMENELRAFATERVAQLVRDGGGNICPLLTEALPALVVLRLLGLAPEALEEIRRWAMMGGDLLAGRIDAARLAHLLSETGEQYQFLADHVDLLLARAKADRGESLTATLAGGVDEGLISREQAIGILVILFGAAGESTASLIGSAVRLLAEDPELQARLRADPSLVPAFVEESVRLESPFKFHYRVVRRETELCGVPLLPGDTLLLGWASANRDPSVWSDPDSLRLDRHHGDRHLGFGYGIHFCIGAPLARLEARVVIESLLQGTCSFVTDPARKPIHVPSIFVRRLQHLHLVAR